MFHRIFTSLYQEREANPFPPFQIGENNVDASEWIPVNDFGYVDGNLFLLCDELNGSGFLPKMSVAQGERGRR